MVTANVVFHGSSNTAGFLLSSPSTQAYPALLAASLAATGYACTVYNQGISGAAFHDYGSNTSLITDALTNVDPKLGPNAVLVVGVDEGENDIFFGGAGSASAAYGYFQSYVAARLSAGWLPSNILVCSPCPRAGDAWSDVSAYTSSVSGGASGNYTFVQLDSNICSQNANLSSTYYQSDNVHLTAAGHQQAANDLLPFLTLVLPRPGWVASFR
jgi:lysophospholipase L1-like esterase